MIQISIPKNREKEVLNFHIPFYYYNDLSEYDIHKVYGKITDNYIIRIIKRIDSFEIKKESHENFDSYSVYFLNQKYHSSEEEFEAIKKEIEEFFKTI